MLYRFSALVYIALALLLIGSGGTNGKLVAANHSPPHANHATHHDSLLAINTLSQFVVEHYHQLFAAHSEDASTQNNALSTHVGAPFLSGLIPYPAHQTGSVVSVNSSVHTDVIQTTISLHTNSKTAHTESAASYTVTQNRSTYRFIDLTILVHRHPTVKLSLSQHKLSTVQQGDVSIWLEHNKLYRDIPLQTSIKAVLSSGWHTILDHSADLVAWNTLLKNGRKSANIPTIVDTIRPYLPLLPDADDGAMNQYGELVAIETGDIRNDGGGFNCSGFSKWIVDSLYFPLTNRYLAIDTLTTKHYALRGTGWSTVHEENRDPYFGLDWSRALAFNLLRAQTTAFDTKTLAELQAAIDVVDDTHFRQLSNIGYAVTDLYQLLYQLSLTEPDTFYIGSVNGEFMQKNERGVAVPLRQHFHIVIFFPYFDQHDTFQIAVFERNTEVTIGDFIDRNHMHDIHLVRLKAIDADIAPPTIKNHG